ncbi:neuronal-specific septin-3 isoform X2 [Tupaia chinensis]|uniref:neuronal-specific septin-3 isoform X2 n=1 Tax=Tupaia chinensis TaxID=246437 RepID=UPI000FFB0C3F|nr:neuronal-specific septin-3 isoform X2 [Tupaia chinensis]
MDRDVAPAPPDTQLRGLPASSPRSHMLGRTTRPSRLPGGASPLIPVLRKTIHLDAFPQSHVPQMSRRPGLGARAQSLLSQEAGVAPGPALSPLPANSLAPRKLSSISLTLRQNNQVRPRDPRFTHWEELPTPGREAAAHGGRRLPSPGSPMTLVPGGRVHSEGPGNPGLTKPSRVPTVEKPLVSSYLALPFQSGLVRKSPNLAGPGPAGHRLPVPVTAHTPIRASPGRSKSRPRGIPRSWMCTHRTPVIHLAAVDARPGIARPLATMATDRPSVATCPAAPNTSGSDTSPEFPAPDSKLGTVKDPSTDTTKPGPAMNLTTVRTTNPDTVMDFITPDPDEPGKTMAAESTAKPSVTTGGTGTSAATPGPGQKGTAKPSVTTGGTGTCAATPGPGQKGTAKPSVTTEGTGTCAATPGPGQKGTAKLAMALAGATVATLDTTLGSPAVDISRLGAATGSTVPVTPDPATAEVTLGCDNWSTPDFATYPPVPSRGANPALGHVTDAAVLELARESKGLPETRTDTAMSELVPEPRPKPAVPMKPVSINSNLLGYIGIDTIIEQMRRKTMKTGFDFNIMVVGQSGLGKSTLVNTLFKSQVSRKASSWNREEKIPKTVEIKAIGHVIEEGGVKMKLTVIDTPGFGDQINNENCWEPIEKYINEQYEKFLKEEVNIARKKRIPDTRVHCCLYFISPTGHSLRPLDLEFMKHLSKVVNIIPVIAKADTMTLEEKSEFKQRVRKELEVNGIEFYPQKEFDEDLEDKTENDKIRESMPFAVVGSDKEYQVNGKRVLGRKTPWGIIEVENLNHCEFALLRDFVIRTHLQDLKEVTHNIHYETYRAKRLNDNGGLPPGEGLLGTALPPVPATPCPTAD